MDKNRFMLGILIAFLLLSISFALAETNSEKVDNAYTCLRNKINEKKCSTLSTEEQIFSLMTISKCKSEVNSVLEKNVKTTAQAILALNEAGFDTDDAETWLQAQTQPSSELDWYLQIESSEPTTCKITYDLIDYNIDIGEDKRISSRAGTCLTLAQDDYWLKVKSTCYNKKFTISCDTQFFTNLLYQKEDSSIIYLLEQRNSASADGTTEERVDSLCFKRDGYCDYESTLWAALALDKKDWDTYYYLPYLISMAEENENYLPGAFLYLLTGNENYKDNLLLKQNPSYYWEESDNRYYDTALALYALQKDESPQKSDAKKWLLDVQNDDGCWKGITETAFLLYAAWPEGTSVPIVENDCEKEGYYCMSKNDCEGNVLDYDCDHSGDICCDKQKTLKTCRELKGEICKSNEECDEREVDSSDGDCCLGTCEKKSEPSTEPEEKSYWYIWVLVFLIILTIVGIIFRDKIRPYWFRLKSKFSRGGPPSSQRLPPPGFLPPSTPRQRLMPRRIIPSRTSATQKHPISKKPKTPKDKEFSDVLKKLKEIGS